MKTHYIMMEFAEQFIMGNAIIDIKMNDINLILSDHHMEKLGSGSSL